MPLRGQVVDFVGLDGPQERNQPRSIGKIAVVQKQPRARIMDILVEMIDATGVKSARSPD